MLYSFARKIHVKVIIILVVWYFKNFLPIQSSMNNIMFLTLKPTEF